MPLLVPHYARPLPALVRPAFGLRAAAIAMAYPVGSPDANPMRRQGLLRGLKTDLHAQATKRPTFEKTFNCQMDAIEAKLKKNK